MWVKQTTAQLPGITDSTPLQMSMHIWIYWGKLLKFRLTSATALREKGHLGRWAGRGKLSPEGDRKLSGHRQLQTLKSSIKRTTDNTLMSYRSFYNNHREQNVQKRQRNCARRHDHHIIPGYWSGYQNLAKSALCAENCASTSGSSLRSHLKQLQVRRTQMHSSQSSIVNGRPRKTWRHTLLIRCATRNPAFSVKPRLTPCWGEEVKSQMMYVLKSRPGCAGSTVKIILTFALEQIRFSCHTSIASLDSKRLPDTQLHPFIVGSFKQPTHWTLQVWMVLVHHTSIQKLVAGCY